MRCETFYNRNLRVQRENFTHSVVSYNVTSSGTLITHMIKLAFSDAEKNWLSKFEIFRDEMADHLQSVDVKNFDKVLIKIFENDLRKNHFRE